MQGQLPRPPPLSFTLTPIEWRRRMEACRKSVGFAVISTSPSSPLPSSERLFICLPRGTFTILYQRGDCTHFPPRSTLLLQRGKFPCRIGGRQLMLFLDKGQKWSDQKWTRGRHGLGVVNCINESTSGGNLRRKVGHCRCSLNRGFLRRPFEWVLGSPPSPLPRKGDSCTRLNIHRTDPLQKTD